MKEVNAVITGIGRFLPDYVLTNEELSTMVDTSDEWIMSRVGIKERRILKGEQKGASEMGAAAVKDLLQKTNTAPEDVDLVICTTVTPDHIFPATAPIICDKAGLPNIPSFDMNAGCSGFIYAMDLANKLIKSGAHKKIILVQAEKMSSITDYTDRTTCVLFGDAGTAVMIEPSEENLGVMDTILHSDGMGRDNLHLKAGGSVYPPSHETIDNKWHYIYQEGQTVFKHAVSNMADVSAEIMERNNLKSEDVAWLVPHQANLRIIDATARRMGLGTDRVMINIEKYGNTTSCTIPLCLHEWESKLKKGDNIVLAAFGAGFTWGSIYLKWGYNS